MADGLLTQGLNYIDQQKQALAARLGLLMNNPQEFAAQLGSEARQRAGVGLLGEPKTAQEMASGAWINSPYGQQAMQAGSGFAGTIIGKPLNNPLNTLDRMSPWFIKYPKASDIVDGLKVGEIVKNQSSIPASFSKYEIEKGIKSIPISDFKSSPTDLFRSADDLKRVSELAKQIKQNKYIDPLIVAVDEKGPYILEGGHRLGALNLLGIKNFPAMVVRDLDY